LENLVARGYELKDFEANIIIPYVLEKSGSSKENIVAAFKSIIALLSQVIL